MRGIFTLFLFFGLSFIIQAQTLVAQGPNFGATASNRIILTESNYRSWTSPEGALSSGNGAATITLQRGPGTNFNSSNYLLLTGYDFDVPNSSYPITGIEVKITQRYRGNNEDLTGTVRLAVNGVINNSTAQTFTPTYTGTTTGSLSTITIGSPTNTLGLTNLTGASVNNSQLGVAIELHRISNGNNQSYTADIDVVTITVYYSNPAPTATDNVYPRGTLTESVIGNVINDGTADSDPQNETLTAQLVSGPDAEAGTFDFTFAPNGSGDFSFIPGPNFAGGQVTFTYRLVDNGTPPSTSNDATVTLIYPERALPVEFISFDAKKADNGVQLTWKVGTEVDVDRYEVERSSNGSSFTKIGIVTATQSPSYSFKDVNPLSGTAYYRVRNVDRDGQFKYTTVAKYSNGKSEMQFKAFPTSTKGQVTFQHPSAAGRATISVHTLEGRTVRSLLPAQGAISTQVDLSALPAGTYLLKYQSESGSSETFRIIKQ